jgi:hypothetical protein
MAGGQGATFGQGSLGNSVSARLRSKKSDGGSATAELSGSQIATAQGEFAKTRSKALSGSASTTFTGQVTPSQGTPSQLIVDEVSSDSQLASHPNVLWYPGNDSLSASLLPGDWYADPSLWAPTFKYVAGWDGNGDQAIVPAPEFGMNAVRWGSQYTGNIDDFATIQSWNKWVSSSSPNKPSAAVAIGSATRTEAYFRFMVMVEPDVATGMTETGMKLSGLNHFTSYFCIFWYAPPSGGRVQLFRYMNSASFGPELGSTSGQMDVSTFLNLGQWYALEMFVKMNTNASTSDGELRMWVDDSLIFSRTGFKWFDTAAANLGVHDARGQIYHGGTGLAPSSQIHHRQFGFCLATRRIGRAKNALPYTLPDEGESVQIALNTADEFCPPDWAASGNAAKWPECLWVEFGTGGGLVEDYSANGAFVIAGTGGHGAPTNVGGLAFDFSTGRFEVLNPQGTGYSWYKTADYTPAQTTQTPGYEIIGSGGSAYLCWRWNQGFYRLREARRTDERKQPEL